MTKAKMLTFQFACVINFFYVSHIEGLCNSESLVNRIFEDSSWQGSKSAKQRLYVIGGESPNKKWMDKAIFLGCLPFTWANRTGWRCSCLIFYQLFPHYFCKKWIGATNENSDVDLREMESKTRYRKISLRNRVYHLHKFISFTDNYRENKTKQNNFFYNNWANPRALIGRELWSMRV